MPVKLDHINVRCSDLDATRRFLEDVIGLTVGKRPSFTFPGYWMYDDAGRAVVHLIELGRDPGPSGAVDHVAFYFEDLPAQLARMEAQGIACAFREIPGYGLKQGFIEGPDGLKYEIQGAGA